MTLDQRKSKILLKLASSQNNVTVAELAHNFKVSPRTIRYDLDKIDDFMRNHNFLPLSRKKMLESKWINPKT